MTTMTAMVETIQKQSTLHMQYMEFNVRDINRWMGMRKIHNPEHAAHCLLTECFGELAPKPFRIIVPTDSARGIIYGYGTADAEDLRTALALFADPVQAEVIAPDQIRCKAMPSEWDVGRRLGFEVRVRPTITIPRGVVNNPNIPRELLEGPFAPGITCDAYAWEIIKNNGTTKNRQEVYTEWLAQQFERHGGAVLEPGSVRMTKYRYVKASRWDRGKYSTGPDAVLRGIIQVTDGEEFARHLTRGVGRHRAYGFGMLMLKPAI